MQNETLEAIRQSAAIPSMPLVATRCFEMTQDPNCSYEKLVGLLSTDPGIAAEILRLSNAPLFGVMRKIVSLKQAVTLLGLKRTRDLVLMRYIVQRIDQSRTEPIDITYFWRRSLSTAVVASRLAEPLASRQREEAFIAGLLADTGVIVLAKALPSKYTPVASHYKPHGNDDWLELETRLLGVGHGEVSAMVLERWALPQILIDAVRHHHDPVESMPADAPWRMIAAIINAAGTIARALAEAQNPARAADTCVEAIERVGLAPSVLVDILPQVEADVSALAETLRVDVIPNKLFKLVADQIVANLGQPSA